MLLFPLPSIMTFGLTRFGSVRINESLFRSTSVPVHSYSHEIASQCGYHGTTYLGLSSILANGLRESYRPGIDEFTIPGVYVTDYLGGGLYYHATATRFGEKEDHEMPYVRFLLVVEALATPKKNKSYGECRQLIFAAGDVRVLEVHCYRGWDFIDSGERALYYRP